MPHSVEMPAPVNGTIDVRAVDQLAQAARRGCRDRSAIIDKWVLSVRETSTMRYLHTMLRVRNLDDALDFYVNKLGLKETRRRVDEKNRYTLVFLAGPDDLALVEDSKKNGRPQHGGRTDLQLGHRGLRRGALFRPPRLRGRRHLRDLRAADEGRRHHQPPAARRRRWPSCARPTSIRSSCCRRATPLPPQEPWKSMPNTGKW